jgi:pimeloyl-ACP methyl ester carboxylesterase
MRLAVLDTPGTAFGRAAPTRRHASRRTGRIPRASSEPPDAERDLRHLDTPISSSRRGVLRAVSSALLFPTTTPALPARAEDLFCGYYAENQSVTPQWAFKTPWSEGAVDVSGATKLENAKTFLRILGRRETAEEAGHLPVLCLHGGPGLGFKYMETCEILASEKREVASYDQIGCARSSLAKPPPVQTYAPALFAEELVTLRKIAELDNVHVVAHGWGAMLALDHVLDDRSRGTGIASLTLVSCPPSYRRLIADRRRALAKMPAEYAEALLDGDANGARGSNLSEAGKALYAKAWQEWVIRHESARAAGSCYASLSLGGAGAGIGARRGDGPTADGAASASAVARDMTGGMYFTAGGALADWEADFGGRLAQISSRVPATRVLRGENDALSLDAAKELVAGMTRSDMRPRVALVEVPDSGSCVFLDKAADFLEQTNGFVAKYDNLLV